VTASLDRVPIVGVVGAGTMGAGIAQVALEHGHEVVLYDIDREATERGRERIARNLERRGVDVRLDALRTVTSLEDVGAEADLVIEAALEDLELKRTVFRTLDGVARPDVPLATNTSALSVAAIAAATRHPGRVLGLHFFNPAPVMQLVEVVVAPLTDPEVAAAAAGLVTRWDKVPVLVTDTPGFIVNRVNRPFTLEALRIFEAGGASVAEIDAAIEAAGYPMGPFRLMDLVGIDVNLTVARAIHAAFGAERFRPTATQVLLVEAGHLGRKTGRGFYHYADGKRGPVALDPPPTGERATAAQIVERIERAIEAEAALAVAEGVATAEDVDRAMRLGANHPTGPIERALAPGLGR
jgi:3-hydroxybutyryl-CoA dehydrogenase